MLLEKLALLKGKTEIFLLTPHFFNSFNRAKAFISPLNRSTHAKNQRHDKYLGRFV